MHEHFHRRWLWHLEMAIHRLVQPTEVAAAFHVCCSCFSIVPLFPSPILLHSAKLCIPPNITSSGCAGQGSVQEGWHRFRRGYLPAGNGREAAVSVCCFCCWSGWLCLLGAVHRSQHDQTETCQASSGSCSGSGSCTLIVVAIGPVSPPTEYELLVNLSCASHVYVALSFGQALRIQTCTADRSVCVHVCVCAAGMLR